MGALENKTKAELIAYIERLEREHARTRDESATQRRRLRATNKRLGDTHDDLSRRYDLLKWTAGERSKELECLIRFSDLIEQRGNDRERLLTAMPALLVPAMQFPERTAALVAVDGTCYTTEGFRALENRLTFPICISGRHAGAIEVHVRVGGLPRDGEPFLHEEKRLLKAVAERLGHVLERLSISEALRISEERFRMLAENAQDMIYRMSLPDGRYEYVSPAAETLFGYPLRLFDEEPLLIRQAIHPDDRDYFAREWRKLLAGDMSPSYEYRIVTAEGATKYVYQRNTLVCDSAGRPAAIEGIVTDMTERREVLRRLAESEVLFRAMFEQAAVGIARVGLDGVWVEVNQRLCDMLKYTREQLRSLTFQDVTHPDDLHDERRQLERLKRGECAHYSMEMRFVRKDGTVLWVNLTVGLVHEKESSPRYCISVIEDISSRKETEALIAESMAALERSNQELEQFAYVASHDLQEPLRMVSSYTQLLERRYKDQLDQDAKDFINYAVDGARRMQRLINDLLQYSRVSSRGDPFVPTDMQSLLGRVLADLSETLREANGIVTNDDLPIVSVDGSQIARVLQNLISNALKFHGDSAPRVHVGCEEREDEYLFRIIDNGIGIEPQYAERIFVIFQRLHGRQQYRGTGIGLAVCKRIIERHGGRIWVEPTPGEGATFLFTIPRHVSNDIATATQRLKES